MENNHHHTSDYNHKHHIVLQWVTLALCLLVLLAVIHSAFRNIILLRREGYMHRYSMQQQPVQGDLYLRSWMTFSFINQQYHLPADYLKSQLGITSKSYPKVSLNSVASGQYGSPAAVILKTETAIKNYQAAQKPQP